MPTSALPILDWAATNPKIMAGMAEAAKRAKSVKKTAACFDVLDGGAVTDDAFGWRRFPDDAEDDHRGKGGDGEEDADVRHGGPWRQF